MFSDPTQINQHLAQLSGNIEALIAQTDESPGDLQKIEQCLKNHLERIRLNRLSSDSSIFSPLKEVNERYDGIIIFDKTLKVLHYVAPRNYFYGQNFSSSASLSMSDFLYQDDLNVLNDILNSAGNLPANAQSELTFKSGTGSSIKGLMTLKSSGIDDNDNNFTALLRFPGNHEQLFTTYQATILDNLPGMDVYLFDRDYRFIIAGGAKKKDMVMPTTIL